jgi:hypothetical protein
MLNIIDKTVLIALNDKGRLVRAHYLARYGLLGAVLMELGRTGKIVLEDKRIVMLNQSSTGDQILDNALDMLRKQKKPMRAGRFVYSYKLAAQAKKLVFQKLVDNGIAKEEEWRFLGIFPFKRYPVTNIHERDKLIEEVRKTFFSNNTSADVEEAILLSLIAASMASGLVFSREEMKKEKVKLKLIKKGKYYTKGNEMLAGVLEAIYYAISAEAASSAAAGG